VESFVEKGDDITFQLKRVDDSFYGVVFASKGSSMLEKIYKEAFDSLERAGRDFEEIAALLREAKAPGV
jgi:hypothetical protein